MVYEDFSRNFDIGDIVFGLNVPCVIAVLTLAQHGRVNEHTISDMEIGIQNQLTSAVWDPAFPDRYSRDPEFSYLEKPARARGFREFLRRHYKYDIAWQWGQGFLQSLDKTWKRTSKAGLEYQVRRGRTVHFILRGLMETMGHVAAKRGNYGSSVTASELRWIFRHRNIPEVRANIRFWLPDREVPFNEVFARPEWQAYGRSSSWPPSHIALTDPILREAQTADDSLL